MTYSLLLLDYDGTLCDTKPAIIHSAQETCRFFGIEVPSNEQISELITGGMRIVDAFAVLAKDQVLDAPQWLDKYREIYRNEGDAQAELYGGVEDTLRHLAQQNVSLVVLSNKGVAAVEQSLRRFGLEELMTLIIGDGSLPKLKPHRMPYDEIIRQRFPDIAPQNILMVGDTILDISFGNNCGIHSCWASYGYGNPADIHSLNPHHTITAFGELSQIVGNAQ